MDLGLKEDEAGRMGQGGTYGVRTTTDVRMKGCTDVRTDVCTYVHTDGWTDRQTDGWTDFPCVLQDIVPFGAAAQKEDHQPRVQPTDRLGGV